MRDLMSIKKLALLLAVIVATCIGAATAQAQNSRAWVSGVGNDANPCSRTSPCLTFAHALTQTISSGGEINCLDPGNFGPVTINIPVTINCEGVSYGGIEVSAGNGITVTANGTVNLIGLDINGETTPGGSGIVITSNAVVNIRNCKIYGFQSNGVNGYGIYHNPSSTGGNLVVDNVFIANNFAGIYQLITSSGTVTNMTVRNSNINNNSYGIAVQVSGGTHGGATIEQTTLAFSSSYGLFVYGAGAVAVLGGSTVVNNGTGVFAESSGTIYSFKDNKIGGNGNDGTPLTAYPGGPLN